MPLRHERYFDWFGVIPPLVPSLDLHEMIGEKVRAAAQRSRVRDLYDLYQLARQPYDRQLVRRIVVVKCWETRYAFDPAAFLSSLPRASTIGPIWRVWFGLTASRLRLNSCEMCSTVTGSWAT